MTENKTPEKKLSEDIANLGSDSELDKVEDGDGVQKVETHMKGALDGIHGFIEEQQQKTRLAYGKTIAKQFAFVYHIDNDIITQSEEDCQSYIQAQKSLALIEKGVAIVKSNPAPDDKTLEKLRNVLSSAEAKALEALEFLNKEIAQSILQLLDESKLDNIFENHPKTSPLTVARAYRAKIFAEKIKRRADIVKQLSDKSSSSNSHATETLDIIEGVLGDFKEENGQIAFDDITVEKLTEFEDSILVAEKKIYIAEILAEADTIIEDANVLGEKIKEEKIISQLNEAVKQANKAKKETSKSEENAKNSSATARIMFREALSLLSDDYNQSCEELEDALNKIKELEDDLNSKDNEFAEKIATVVAIEKALEEANKKSSDAEEKLKIYEEEIENLKNQLDEREKVSNDALNELEELKKQIEDLQNELQQKNEYINDLEERLKEKEDLEERLKEKEDEIERLKEDEKLQQDELEKRLKEKEDEIERLKENEKSQQGDWEEKLKENEKLQQDDWENRLKENEKSQQDDLDEKLKENEKSQQDDWDEKLKENEKSQQDDLGKRLKENKKDTTKTLFGAIIAIVIMAIIILCLLLSGGDGSENLDAQNKLISSLQQENANKEQRIASLQQENAEKDQQDNTNMESGTVKLAIKKINDVPDDFNLFKADPTSCIMKNNKCLPFNFVNIATIVGKNNQKKNYLIAFSKEDKGLRVYISPMRLPASTSKGMNLSVPNVKSFTVPVDMF